MKLRFSSKEVTFPRSPLLMGIVNINDDSFSGDGTLDPDGALAQARQQIADGADMIDIGAESARTNRDAISIDEEVRQYFRDPTGRPVDGILGMDFLTNGRALLDSGSRILYMGKP
ncbi:dihydropteroate synthase [Akkermansiaceae bacterium]|nr:dihydropteroate synthase [Akkermansiaceae bacterium]